MHLSGTRLCKARPWRVLIIGQQQTSQLLEITQVVGLALQCRHNICSRFCALRRADVEGIFLSNPTPRGAKRSHLESGVSLTWLVLLSQSLQASSEINAHAWEEGLLDLALDSVLARHPSCCLLDLIPSGVCVFFFDSLLRLHLDHTCHTHRGGHVKLVYT
jgi:hypothetical protein